MGEKVQAYTPVWGAKSSQLISGSGMRNRFPLPSLPASFILDCKPSSFPHIESLGTKPAPTGIGRQIWGGTVLILIDDVLYRMSRYYICFTAMSSVFGKSCQERGEHRKMTEKMDCILIHLHQL